MEQAILKSCAADRTTHDESVVVPPLNVTRDTLQFLRNCIGIRGVLEIKLHAHLGLQHPIEMTIGW